MKTAILIICLVGLAALSVAAIACAARRALRGRTAWAACAFAAFALVAALSAQKGGGGTSGKITYPSNGDATYLTDNGSTLDAESNTATFNWTRTVAPDTASVYVSRRPLDSTDDADWVDAYSGTFAETELPLTIQGDGYLVTNCNWMVYTDWTPGPSVETNGVWHTHWAWSQPDKAHILPMRATVAVVTGNGLPDGYTECEYLQSTGTQYINTGRIAQMDDAVEIKANITGGKNGNPCLFCARRNNSQATAAFLIGVNSLRLDYTGQIQTSIGGRGVDMTVRLENGCWYYNGKLAVKNVLTDKETGPMLIFHSGYYSHQLYKLDNYANGKLYYFKQWDVNMAPVFDMIPALDPSGTPCMFDRVTRQPFYNSGTGTFGYKIKE